MLVLVLELSFSQSLPNGFFAATAGGGAPLPLQLHLRGGALYQLSAVEQKKTNPVPILWLEESIN
jgi:hypothetical protein